MVPCRATSTRSDGRGSPSPRRRTSWAAALRRRRARLRATALPIFLVAVKPTLTDGEASGGKARACTTSPGMAHRRLPAATARNSLRFLRRPTVRECPVAAAIEATSGGKALAALRATACEHLAAIFGRHAGPEAMTAFPHQLARLVSALHSDTCRP